MDQYDFFIVRVWRRDGAAGEQWTGRLEHLQGQDGWRFGDADALLAYLRNLIGSRRGLIERPSATSTQGQDEVETVGALPRLDLMAVVTQQRYRQRHKLAAYWSHRKRRLRRLGSRQPP